MEGVTRAIDQRRQAWSCVNAKVVVSNDRTEGRRIDITANIDKPILPWHLKPKVQASAVEVRVNVQPCIV